MADELRERIRANPAKGFKPTPYYSPEGDFVSVYFRDVDHYARREDALLTVYLSMDTHELVGCKIKGVRRIIKTLGRFDCIRNIEDGKGKIEVRILLMPGMALAEDREQLERYEDLDEATADLHIDADQFELV